MELRHKDNLTDLIEGLPKKPVGSSSTPARDPKNQEVTTADGEVVILGYKNTSSVHSSHKVVPLELPRGEILRVVARAIEKAFNNLRLRK